jgi:RNA polymerase sigma-70 factor (ECF subfamily)
MADDADLVRQALEGRGEAFGELVRLHLPRVLAVCRRYAAGEPDAQDLAQDAFVRAYLKLGQLRDPERFGSWLGAVARSVCVNSLHGRNPAVLEGAGEDRELEVPSDDPGPHQMAEARELADAILRHIGRLPYEYREPFELYYLGQLSHKDIGTRMGITPGNVRTRLHRARKMMRSWFSAFDPGGVSAWSRELRTLLPFGRTREEGIAMALNYAEAKHRVLRGDKVVTIRAMTREDIPAVLRYDSESSGAIPRQNLEEPPGYEDTPGGPWSNEKLLLEHFNKYQAHGGLSLLAFDDTGRVVGMVDLWKADEPEPFGLSLDVEYISQEDDYYPLGLSLVLLREAEKVAATARIPWLDVGTNTAEDTYNHMRHFGLRVFYEYDHVLCDCRRKPAGGRPAKRMLTPRGLGFAGMLKVDHWSPTDLRFESDEELAYIAELKWPDGRAILELLGPTVDDICLPVPKNKPVRCHLYVDAASLKSTAGMSRVLAECASLAGEAGAEQIELPCASDAGLDASLVDVIRRDYMYAWFRKKVE